MFRFDMDWHREDMMKATLAMLANDRKAALKKKGQEDR